MPTATLRTLTRFRFSNNAATKTISRNRPFSTTRPVLIKDSLKDRTAINTESTEYSKSGSDAEAAHKDTAFKPGETNPQEEMGSQEKSQGDALNVSPGNHDISQPLKSDQGGAEKSASSSAGEQKSSGGGSPAKGKKIS